MPGDPGNYRKTSSGWPRLTPAEVKSAMQRWLSRPSYNLAVVPGEAHRGWPRQSGGWGDEYRRRVSSALLLGPGEFPAVAEVDELTFHQIERAS